MDCCQVCPSRTPLTLLFHNRAALSVAPSFCFLHLLFGSNLRPKRFYKEVATLLLLTTDFVSSPNIDYYKVRILHCPQAVNELDCFPQLLKSVWSQSKYPSKD